MLHSIELVLDLLDLLRTLLVRFKDGRRVEALPLRARD